MSGSGPETFGSRFGLKYVSDGVQRLRTPASQKCSFWGCEREPCRCDSTRRRRA